MTTPNSAATPASAMKPTALATDRLWPSSHSSQKPPTSAERQRRHDQQRLVDAPEGQVQQHEDDQQRRRHHQLQLRAWRAPGTRTAPTTRPSSRAAASPLAPPPLHVAHGRRAGRARGCRRRPSRTGARSRCAASAGRRRCAARPRRRSTDLRAASGDDGQRAQLFERVAHLARIAHVDRKALQALDRLADVLAADRRRRRRPARRRCSGRSARPRRGRCRRRCSARRSAARRVRRRHAGHGLAPRARSRRSVRSISARSGPATLTPTGLLMPVASMSMRLRIGGTQMLDSPGTCTMRSSSSTSLSRRHARRATARAA